MYIDFHSHFPDTLSIVCTDRPVNTVNSNCLMNCQGLLPSNWTREAQEELFRLLENNERLQLGEVGLDKRFHDKVPMEKQEQNLETQLRFAIAHNRSVSLHCVQSTGRLLTILSKLHYRPYSILWHGFTGSMETAAELFRLKVLISIGPKFKGNPEELFEANPNMVLETDYETGCETGCDKRPGLKTGKNHGQNHDYILKTHYERCAVELGITANQLSARCLKMFALFSIGDVQQK
ncbi:MAG: TatD family hydrolase [Sphaerochaeta sp.]